MPGETKTRAVVMRSYGGPDVLRVETRELAPLGPSEIRIRTLAAAVNHSDLEIRSGAWPILRDQPFPYVPGLEVVGEVEAIGPAVHSVRVGERVITMMQGLGGVYAKRDGGYAEHVTVDASVVAIVPREVDPLHAAALGLGAVTAFQGLSQLGSLDGRRVLVTGAAGGVGSNAVALAAAQGARVTALVRSTKVADYLRSIGAQELVTEPKALAPGSIDAALDTVAGPLFEPVLGALSEGGRYSLVGAMAGDRVSFSAWELMRRVSLTGYSTEALDGDSLRGATSEIFRHLVAGKLRAPAFQKLALEDAARAHQMLEAKGVQGRLLLVPR